MLTFSEPKKFAVKSANDVLLKTLKANKEVKGVYKIAQFAKLKGVKIFQEILRGLKILKIWL